MLGHKRSDLKPNRRFTIIFFFLLYDSKTSFLLTSSEESEDGFPLWQLCREGNPAQNRMHKCFKTEIAIILRDPFLSFFIFVSFYWTNYRQGRMTNCPRMAGDGVCGQSQNSSKGGRKYLRLFIKIRLVTCVAVIFDCSFPWIIAESDLGEKSCRLPGRVPIANITPRKTWYTLIRSLMRSTVQCSVTPQKRSLSDWTVACAWISVHWSYRVTVRSTFPIKLFAWDMPSISSSRRRVAPFSFGRD